MNDMGIFPAMGFNPAGRSGLLQKVCVFCGASPGADPAFAIAATALGRRLALEGVDLVYGGGANGLMGAVAHAAAQHGGHVTAVVPGFIESRAIPLPFPHEIVRVDDMHTRKKIMFERADAFIALPGGIGTIEELTELVTLHKLEQSRKPLLIANFGRFWDPLLELFSHLQRSGFLCGDALDRCLVTEHPDAMLPMLRSAMVASSPSWAPHPGPSPAAHDHAST
ncbi:MAG TPA: TIGR00730 family Rossman fold protein [Devosia sp.]|nr:TIGR00730 family Rossman fold protein [Devosia sp.]